MENEDFWAEVKEHYTYKKKNLINFINPSRFDSISRNKTVDTSNYKNFSCDELKTIYKKFDGRGGMTSSEWDEKYYIEILLNQFEPLKPPYSKEEIDAMMKTVDCSKIGIPLDLYEYLTKVSREHLFFNEQARLIDMNKLSSFKEHITPIKNTHVEGCNCFYEMGDYCSGLEICLKLPEEEKEKLREDIKRQEKEMGDLAQIDGIYLGSNTGSYGGEKILACGKNSIFGKIYKNYDDSYSMCYDMYSEYAKSLKELIKIKMEREKNAIYDYDSDCYSGSIYPHEKKWYDNIELSSSESEEA